MNSDVLKLELSVEAHNLKDLADRLNDLIEDLEFCSCNSEIYNELMHVEKLSGEIFEIIDTMEAFKHMSEI